MQRTNTLAIVSIVAAVLSWMGAPLIASVIAVACGHIARKQIRVSYEGGDGLALAGLIIGYLNLVGVIVALLVFFLGFGGLMCAGMAASATGG